MKGKEQKQSGSMNSTKKSDRKSKKTKQAESQKNDLGFHDYRNLMRSRSYSRGPGGAIRQRTF